MPGSINFGLIDAGMPAKIAATYEQGQQRQMQNALAAQQMQHGAMQNQVAKYQIQKMIREDQMLTDLAAKVKAAGGPDNLPAIADALIATGNPQHIAAGIALKQKIQSRQALLSAAGGGAGPANPMNPNGHNPSVMAGAAGTAPPTNAMSQQTGRLDPTVLNLLAQDEPITTKAAEMLNNQLIEGRKPIVTRGQPVIDSNGRMIFQGGLNVPGMTYQYGPGGVPISASRVPGFTEAQAAQAAATAAGQEAGKAPYGLETLNTEGAPTLMTRQQAIEAATGQRMPTPGMTVTPTAQRTRDETRLRILQDELKANPTDIALKSELATTQKRMGLRLQDQGESARQKAYGTERGQLEAAKPAVTRTLGDAVDNVQRLQEAARGLAQHPGLKGITAIKGAFPDIPGSDAANARAELFNLLSQTATTTLQAIRNAAKTGGALGSVSDADIELLKNNLASLKTSQSAEAMQKNLDVIIKWGDRIKGRMQNAYDMTYKGAEAITPASGGSAPRGVDPKLWGVMTPEERSLWAK